MALAQATSFLIHQTNLFYTTDSTHSVATLIEGIWTQHSDQARFITRNRVYTILPPSPLSEGMVKVAGKRASVLNPEEFQQKLNEHPSLTSIEVSTNCGNYPSPLEIENKVYSHDEAMQFAKKLSLYSKLGIAAVLLNEKNEIVSWGWNEHFPNKTLHAEVMLVKNYLSRFQRKIPANYTLITTLQPCAMCAGYLHGYCENFSSLKVIYDQPDPGPKAQNSVLVAGSDLWKRAFN